MTFAYLLCCHCVALRPQYGRRDATLSTRGMYLPHSRYQSRTLSRSYIVTHRISYFLKPFIYIIETIAFKGHLEQLLSLTYGQKRAAPLHADTPYSPIACF